jgi:hypothetical protein
VAGDHIDGEIPDPAIPVEHRDSSELSDQNSTERQVLEKLKEAVYHICEERDKQEAVVHRGVQCNACSTTPIRGTRWHCANCGDFDLCSYCEATEQHISGHVFYKITVPVPHIPYPKQEPLYPRNAIGRTEEFDTLCKRLVEDTKRKPEEIQGWRQLFSFLAGKEWPEDPNNIGWAIDRTQFNRAVIPRYWRFTSAPLTSVSLTSAPNLVYDRLFAHFDTDRNGLIGFEEFVIGLDRLHPREPRDPDMPRAKLQVVFNGYDLDGDGYITRKDVLRVFRAYYSLIKEATRQYVIFKREKIHDEDISDFIHSGAPLGPTIMRLDSDEDVNNQTAAGGPSPEKRADDDPQPILQSDTDDTVAQDHEFSGTALSIAIDKEIEEEIRSRNEMPQSEKDIGKDIVYRLTQQGLNELLNPLFLGREEWELEASATQAERLSLATEIEEGRKRLQHGNDEQLNTAMYLTGPWWFGGRILHKMREYTANNRELIRRLRGKQLNMSEAETQLDALFEQAESEVARELLREKDTRRVFPLHVLCESHLFRMRLRHAYVQSFLFGATYHGWIVEEREHQDQGLDPTMPQYRPNSSADSSRSSIGQDQETPAEYTGAPRMETRHIHIHGVPGEPDKSEIALVLCETENNIYLAYENWEQWTSSHSRAVLDNTRHIAKKTDSPLHLDLLAAHAAVEEEQTRRGGPGRVNFDEFEGIVNEHNTEDGWLREGLKERTGYDHNMRFLEAWTEVFSY